MIIKLNEVQKALLLATLSACKSLHTHVPWNYIFNKLNTRLRNKYGKKLKSKHFRKLIILGLVMRHPTAGEMTYELSKQGLDLAKKIYNEEKGYKFPY